MPLDLNEKVTPATAFWTIVFVVAATCLLGIAAAVTLAEPRPEPPTNIDCPIPRRCA